MEVLSSFLEELLNINQKLQDKWQEQNSRTNIYSAKVQ